MAFDVLGPTEIVAEDERALAPELGAGERLLWAGHPRRGLRLVMADALLIPFSMLWCGFAIFWERNALAAAAPGFFALWGVPFVAMGLYMVFGRFIADAVRRSKITYGLTPRRLILISGVLSRQVKSIDLSSLGELSVGERRDGSGTITLGTSSSPTPWGVSLLGPSWPGAAGRLPPMLEAVEHARAVYEKIRTLKSQARDR